MEALYLPTYITHTYAVSLVTHQFISSDMSRYNPRTSCLNTAKCILAQQTEELCSELVPLLKDAGPTHSKSGPPEILCKHSCLPNYTAYTNHWGLAHLSTDQNIFGGMLYHCYKNTYSIITISLHIVTFINKKVMQPAHIWIIDHVGHNRKNLNGSS